MCSGCKSIDKQNRRDHYLVAVHQAEVDGRVRDDVTFLGQSSLTFDLFIVDDLVEQTIDSEAQNSVRAQTLANQTTVLHLVLQNHHAPDLQKVVVQLFPEEVVSACESV